MATEDIGNQRPGMGIITFETLEKIRAAAEATEPGENLGDVLLNVLQAEGVDWDRVSLDEWKDLVVEAQRSARQHRCAAV